VAGKHLKKDFSSDRYHAAAVILGIPGKDTKITILALAVWWCFEEP